MKERGHSLPRCLFSFVERASVWIHALVDHKKDSRRIRPYGKQAAQQREVNK